MKPYHRHVITMMQARLLANKNVRSGVWTLTVAEAYMEAVEEASGVRLTGEVCDFLTTEGNTD